MRKYIISNNRIRAKEVRLVDENGEQQGVLSLSDALKKAQAVGLDLIQVTEKVDPPICKIMEYGKYAYQVSKKEKKQSSKGGEMKSIRLTFGISPHDMETRAKAANKFMAQGSKLRIEMRLKGRQKALGNHAIGKVKEFLKILEKDNNIKIERELKREPRGFTMIVSKSNKEPQTIQQKDENTQSPSKKV